MAAKITGEPGKSIVFRSVRQKGKNILLVNMEASIYVFDHFR